MPPTTKLVFKAEPVDHDEADNDDGGDDVGGDDPLLDDDMGEIEEEGIPVVLSPVDIETNELLENNPTLVDRLGKLAQRLIVITDEQDEFERDKQKATKKVAHFAISQRHKQALADKKRWIRYMESVGKEFIFEWDGHDYAVQYKETLVKPKAKPVTDEEVAKAIGDYVGIYGSKEEQQKRLARLVTNPTELAQLMQKIYAPPPPERRLVPFFSKVKTKYVNSKKRKRSSITSPSKMSPPDSPGSPSVVSNFRPFRRLKIVLANEVEEGDDGEYGGVSPGRVSP